MCDEAIEVDAVLRDVGIASVTNNNDLVFSQCFCAFDIYTSLLVITNQNHNHYEGNEKIKNDHFR